VENFKQVYKRNREVLEHVVNFEELDDIRCMSDLDKKLCETVYGLPSVEKYWEEASAVDRLRGWCMSE
jgi:predicted alpha/beta-fold hydrolase